MIPIGIFTGISVIKSNIPAIVEEEEGMRIIDDEGDFLVDDNDDYIIE
jgi:hypothetical protein